MRLKQLRINHLTIPATVHRLLCRHCQCGTLIRVGFIVRLDVTLIADTPIGHPAFCHSRSRLHLGEITQAPECMIPKHINIPSASPGPPAQSIWISKERAERAVFIRWPVSRCRISNGTRDQSSDLWTFIVVKASDSLHHANFSSWTHQLKSPTKFTSCQKVACYGSVSKSSGQWEGGGGGGETFKPRARSKAVQRMRRLRFHSGIFANPAGKIVIFNFFQEPPHFAEMNSN